MKKNSYANYPLGQEITGITFQQHQDQVEESVKAMMRGLGLDPALITILYGLSKVDKVGEFGYTVSEGAVFHNDEIFLVATFDSGNLTSTPVLEQDFTDVGGAVRIGDDSTESVHFDRKYKVTPGGSGSGLVDLSATQRLDEVLYDLLDPESYVDQQVNDLIGGADTNFDTFAKVAAAIKSVNSGGTTNQVAGSSLDYQTPPLADVNSESPVHIPLADIPSYRLTASTDVPRVIKVFCDLFYSRQGADDDDFYLSLVYREGPAGNWQPIRRKYLKANGSVQFVSIRGHVVLDQTPADTIQFGVEAIHNTGLSVRLSSANEIEFDTIY